MGVYQPVRGNAENKLFFKIDKLIGGINTEFSDDTSPDNEFKEIINFDMDTRGSLHKRLGFGKLDAVSQIFNLFKRLPTVKGKTPADPRPEKLNDNIVYMKLLQNDNKVFRNLSAFSGPKAYREYQKLYGSQNNTFKLLMITTSLYEKTSTAWFYKVTLPALNVDGSGKYTDEDTIVIEEKVTDLPVIFNWNKTLLNIETIDFFNKIYFTTNDKGLVMYDRANDTFSYYGKNVPNNANVSYKPTAMEIRKVGFNMLGDDPLYWVDYQGLSTNSIQGVYLTTMDNIPTQVLPFGGKFRINILYTGANGGFTFSFKEGEQVLTYTATSNATLSKTGLAVYDIVISNVPTSEIEIKIEKTGATIDPYYDYYNVGSPDPEAKPVEALNIGDYGICEMYNRAVYYKGDTLWFSEINKFDYVPNYNYVSLPIEPIDEITKVIFFRNVHIIFTRYRIYKMIGQFGTTSFQVMPVNVAVGCHAPNTIVPIENELYFASPRGLYSLRSSEFRDGIENLKELDTKVKSLTSDMSLYLKDLTDPAIHYNGISERAYSIRYKDKYMLFFNTAYEAGELTAPFQSDALVYKYELRAFVAIKFPIKPTFMFFVDNAIETFCTVKEKEDYTKEETLLEYDFETGTSNNIIDKTGHNLDGTLTNGYLQPGYGVKLDGVDGNIKIANVDSSVDLTNGFEINIDAKATEVAEGMTLFDLGQLVASSSAGPSSGSISTNWSNGYRLELIYNTTPNANENQSMVFYIARLHRDGTSRNASQTGSFSLREGSTTLASSDFSYNFGSSLFTDVKTGSFIVSHDGTGNYNENWTLSLYTRYPTYSTGYDKGPTQYFDVVQGGSWDSLIGMRIAGRAEAYNWGARVYLTPALHCEKRAIIYTGARAIYTWANGQQNSQTLGAVSTDGSAARDFWGYEQYVDVYYTGQPTIFIDGQYNIKSHISGTYRENVDIAGFNFTLPYVNTYNITTWNDFTTTGTSLITFNQISSQSKREIYVRIYKNNTLKIGANSEFDTDVVITPSNSIDDLRHKWTFRFSKDVATYIVSVYKDEELLTTSFVGESAIVNAIRDNCLIGKSNSDGSFFKGEIYSFSWKLLNGTIITSYDFLTGRGSTVNDISTGGRNGNLNGGVTWLVENGLRLNGINSYVTLPDLGADIQWSNGFKIEFEAKLDNYTQLSKIIDLAISHGTESVNNQKCNINIGTLNNKNGFDFISSSIDLKTIKTSIDNVDTTNRHKWTFAVVDNGNGYIMTIHRDDILMTSNQFNYGGITNVTRKSNYIGKSNVQGEGYLKGMLYNMKISINASANPTPVYVGSLYEYDTTYDDFGKPMEIALETKGINLNYPLHIKKLKNIFVKGLGGFTYQNFLCFVKSDGHLANNPYIYNCYIDPDTHEVVYEYEENRELNFNEKVSLLGNMRLNHTSLGESTYETRKIVVPAKGKNFSFRFQGESNDSLSIESIGFVVKLGKVKEK